MKILRIYGEENSALLVVEDMGITEAAKLAEDNGGSFIIDKEDEYYAKLEIIEFGEVDPKFINFIVSNYMYEVGMNDDNFYILDK